MLATRIQLYIISLVVIIVSTFNSSIANLAILAMVKDYNSQEIEVNISTCNKHANSSSAINSYGGTLDWSADVQYAFLVSPFVGNLISQFVAGSATLRYGTKKVVTVSLFGIFLCNFILPFGSNIHCSIAIIVQTVHGFVQGAIWPGISGIIPFWIPLHEQGRFQSCFQGRSIGNMLSQLMSGVIISSIGWTFAFIIPAALALILGLIWLFMVYDKPESHKRISAEELKYIQDNRAKLLVHSNKIPWSSLLLSVPLWAIAVSAFSRVWFNSIVLTSGPSYLKNVIGLDVATNGELSSAVSLATFISSLIFAWIADKLIIHKVIGLLTNRKLLIAIGQFPSALLMISLGYLPCDVPTLLGVWALMSILLTACFSGAMANIIDIAPHLVAPVVCIIQFVSVLSNIFSPLVTESILKTMDSLIGWKYVFDIGGGISIVACTMYLIFASTEVQKWDSVNESEDEETKLIEK